MFGIQQEEMSPPQWNSRGWRVCDTKDCDNEAQYWFVWTNNPQVACEECVSRMIGIGQAMGHFASQHTVRPLTVSEMSYRAMFLATLSQRSTENREKIQKLSEENAIIEEVARAIEDGTPIDEAIDLYPIPLFDEFRPDEDGDE